MRHEAGGVVQEQKLPQPRARLQLGSLPNAASAVSLPSSVWLVVSDVVDLVGVVQEVEEVRGEPEVVQGGAQLVHYLQGCQMAKFDPVLSLDCARVEGVGAQSKERTGSNFAA